MLPAKTLMVSLFLLFISSTVLSVRIYYLSISLFSIQYTFITQDNVLLGRNLGYCSLGFPDSMVKFHGPQYSDVVLGLRTTSRYNAGEVQLFSHRRRCLERIADNSGKYRPRPLLPYVHETWTIQPQSVGHNVMPFGQSGDARWASV